MFEKRNPTVGPAQLDQRSELCNDFFRGLAYAGLKCFGLALAYFPLHNYAETCLPPSLRCVLCVCSLRFSCCFLTLCVQIVRHRTHVYCACVPDHSNMWMNAHDFSIVIGPSIAQWIVRLVVYSLCSKGVQLLILDILILTIACNSTLGLIACLYPETIFYRMILKRNRTFHISFYVFLDS